MRREFILVLLGIICISTLSSLMSQYVHIVSDKVLLDTVVGVVGAGNFSYWQCGHTGPLLIELTSLSGDADIYVSDSLRPSYEVDKNNFSSTTCGVDIVSVPIDFPRPVGIGVFGDWSHGMSEYSIHVFLDMNTVVTEEQLRMADQSSYKKPSDNAGEPEAKRGREKAPSRHNEDESKPRFLKLLNILDMIFEMFIL